METPNYRKLIVWQKAHSNALLLIEILDEGHIKFSRLIGQCMSAATSIGANIAEGNCGHTVREKKRYFEIALNSSYELDNWLQVFKDSKTICCDKNKLLRAEQQNVEVIKILSKLISSLNS